MPMRPIAKLAVPKQVEVSFASDEAQDEISTDTATDTTARTVEVSLPSGATIKRALLVAVVVARNGSANTQNIGLNIQARPSGGSWTSVFNKANCIGLPNAEGAAVALAIPQEVSSIVTEPGTYEFKTTVTQSSANPVTYTTIYVLIIAYEM